MKNYKLLINLGVVVLLWFCLAFACKSDNDLTSQRKTNGEWWFSDEKE